MSESRQIKLVPEETAAIQAEYDQQIRELVAEARNLPADGELHTLKTSRKIHLTFPTDSFLYGAEPTEIEVEVQHHAAFYNPSADCTGLEHVVIHDWVDPDAAWFSFNLGDEWSKPILKEWGLILWDFVDCEKLISQLREWTRTDQTTETSDAQ